LQTNDSGKKGIKFWKKWTEYFDSLKPAGSDLVSRTPLAAIWAVSNDFLSDFLYEHLRFSLSKILTIFCMIFWMIHKIPHYKARFSVFLMKNMSQKSVFLIKNRAWKIGRTYQKLECQKLVFLIENRSWKIVLSWAGSTPIFCQNFELSTRPKSGIRSSFDFTVAEDLYKKLRDQTMTQTELVPLSLDLPGFVVCVWFLFWFKKRCPGTRRRSVKE